MSSTASPETGARSRTRRAILSAAASVLGRNPRATLADIAEAAGVGRTTLHRYFPDRDSLVKAAIDDSVEAIERSVDEAAVDQGPPLDAMRRLVAAMVDVGDRLVFLFGDPRVLEEYSISREDAWWTGPPMTSDEDSTLALIERGQAEGVFDPHVSAVWIRHVMWALVYTGIEEAAEGRLPRHGITATVIRTFEHGILTR